MFIGQKLMALEGLSSWEKTAIDVSGIAVSLIVWWMVCLSIREVAAYGKGDRLIKSSENLPEPGIIAQEIAADLEEKQR